MIEPSDEIGRLRERIAFLEAHLYGVEATPSDEAEAVSWLDHWFRAPAGGWKDTLTSRSLADKFAAAKAVVRSVYNCEHGGCCPEHGEEMRSLLNPEGSGSGASGSERS